MEKENRIAIENMEYIGNIFGDFDENLKIIENTFKVRIISRDNEIKILGGTNIDLASSVILKLLDIAKRDETINTHTVNYIISLVMEDNTEELDRMIEDVVIVTARGKYVKCKTVVQKQYVDSISNHEVVFGIGPAGTGKTYLAIAMAIKYLKEKKVSRLVLTRPAVEAGERLGFLPGDLQEKIDPYLKPLYDAIYDILGAETYQKYVESNIIEVAPLAYMRGRTLNDSFIILDEAQNTTHEQMKMFLTRFGYNSRIVVTGDLTQVDLGNGKSSGLKHASEVLRGVEGIDFVNFTYKDVVRHKLVMEIVKAYEKYERKLEKGE